MGREKSLLPWGGTDLLGHTLARLRSLTDDVQILSGGEARYADRQVPVHLDLLADAGPLAGVLTGLERAAGRIGLFLGVDLPLVPAALLLRLAGRQRVAEKPAARRSVDEMDIVRMGLFEPDDLEIVQPGAFPEIFERPKARAEAVDEPGNPGQAGDGQKWGGAEGVHGHPILYRTAPDSKDGRTKILPFGRGECIIIK